MEERIPILCIIGPTGSGKSSRAIAEALARNGEVISVDSRQVYRMLDIGTEKVTTEEMRGVPHHLIDIRDPLDAYSAGDFVADAIRLITEIHSRGKLPILAGGTHFYFDALLNGLPESTPPDTALRAELEKLPAEELYALVLAKDPARARVLHPNNHRRLVRALEIIEAKGSVPARSATGSRKYDVEWIVVDIPKDELRKRIDARLKDALARGLIDEVRRVREHVGDKRLAELGLEYRVIGEYLRGERSEESLFPALSSKLWQYVRRQTAWLRKMSEMTSSPRLSE